MTLGANPSFNAVCRFGEGFHHRTRKAESQVSHKRVIYMERAGDGDSGGVLHTGAGGRKDLKPCLLRVLYRIARNKMLLIFLRHTRGISPPCKELEPCTWHLCVETKSLGLLGAGNPTLGTTVPPSEQGTVDGNPVSSSVPWASQLACAGLEQSPTPS